MGFAPYAEVMGHAVPGNAAAPALEGVVAHERAVSNPLRVRKDYPRRAQLQKDLLRHYENVIVSKSAQRFTGRRRKEYAARVAWSIVERSGRYNDYFATKGRAMTTKKKSAKKSKVAKNRPRDPVTKQFLSARQIAARKAAKKAKRGKTMATKQAARKSSAPKKHTSKPKKSSKKKSTPRPRGAHPAHGKEMVPMAMHTVVYEENPKKDAKKGGKKKGAKKGGKKGGKKAAAYGHAGPKKSPKKSSSKKPAKKKTSSKSSAPKKKSRPRAKSVSVHGTTRKNVGGKSRSFPTTLRIVIGAPQKRRHPKKKGGKKKGGGRVTPPSHQLAAENPIMSASAVYENPLSWGEFAFGAFTTFVGLAAVDFIYRFGATHPIDDPAENPQTQGYSVAKTNPSLLTGPPSLKAIGFSALVPVAGLVGAGMVSAPFWRAGFQGLAIGSAGGILLKLWNHYVMVPMLKDKDLGKRLYPVEIAADQLASGTQQGPRGNLAGPRRHIPYGAPKQAPQVVAAPQRGVGQGAQNWESPAKQACGTCDSTGQQLLTAMQNACNEGCSGDCKCKQPMPPVPVPAPAPAPGVTGVGEPQNVTAPAAPAPVPTYDPLPMRFAS